MRARIERGTSEPIKITKQVARESECGVKRGGRVSGGSAGKVSTLGPEMVTLKPGAMTRTCQASDGERLI